jgi:multiple sugar transport system permease protein
MRMANTGSAEPMGVSTIRAVGHPSLWSRLERETILGPTLLLPALFLLAVFLAYPLTLGIWFSVSDKTIGGLEEHFVGLYNFRHLLSDTIFHRTIWNTMVYSVVTVILKAVLGLALALLLNQHFAFRRFVRAALLLPWIVPTALSTIAWLWIFDPTFSVINWFLVNVFGLSRINWLGDATLAMTSIIIVNVWRGIPFFAISLLAGLQTIAQELYEAASIDGANTVQSFWHVTLPLVRPILLLVTLFSFIWTVADFQLVYVLTRGGPSNSTHLFGTLAYQVAVFASKLGEGAAISLFMLPFLLLCIIVVLWQIRKE